MDLTFDSLRYRYPSQRHLVYGRRGMVCASQPLAAQAGLDMIKKGGNAFDAVLAAAVCLTLVEPMSCNMGGDGFALIWHEGKLYGPNASGPAPMLLSVDALKEAGYNTARLRKEKLLGENAIQSLRKGEVVGIIALEKICKLLDMQPGNIIKYVDSE